MFHEEHFFSQDHDLRFHIMFRKVTTTSPMWSREATTLANFTDGCLRQPPAQPAPEPHQTWSHACQALSTVGTPSQVTKGTSTSPHPHPSRRRSGVGETNLPHTKFQTSTASGSPFKRTCQVLPGLVTNSILFCWLCAIKDRCNFYQTQDHGLGQQFLTLSWDLYT